jgi:hypothetical protein
LIFNSKLDWFMQQMVFLEVAEKIRNQQEQLAGSHC